MAKGCRKVGEYATCGFDIVVTNDGPTAFNDPIVLNDETNFATLATSGSVGFSCDNLQGGATRSHRCGIAAPNIAPHASITVNLESQVWLRTVPVDTPPGGCKLDNTVTIAAPASEGPPPTAKASAPFPVEPNQGRAIPCDPPSLKLAKTAQGCSVSASGFECRYKLTVTSTGPDPYQDAPIEISEALPTGASVTAHSRGWVCSGSGPATQCRTAGDGPNGSGTDGRVTLAVGATVDLDLVVAVPKSAAGRSGCEVSNSAQIVQQGRGLTGAGEQFGAAATAKVDSPECRPSALSCPANYTGVYPTCCRPPAQQYDAAQRACVAATPAALPTIAECYRGMVLVSNRCECPPGTTWNGGTCASAVSGSPGPTNGPTLIGGPTLVGQDRAGSSSVSGGTNLSVNSPQGRGPDRASSGTSSSSPVTGGTNPSVNGPQGRDRAGSGVTGGSCPPGMSLAKGGCFAATTTDVKGTPNPTQPSQAIDTRLRYGNSANPGAGSGSTPYDLKGAGPTATEQSRKMDTKASGPIQQATRSGPKLHSLGRRPQWAAQTTSVQAGSQLKVRGALGRRPNTTSNAIPNTRIRYGGSSSGCPPKCGGPR